MFNCDNNCESFTLFYFLIFFPALIRNVQITGSLYVLYFIHQYIRVFVLAQADCVLPFALGPELPLRQARVCSRRRSPEWGSSRRSACRIPDMPAWTDKPSKLRSTTPPRRCNVSSSWRACTMTFPLRFELNSLSSSNLTQSDLRCLLARDSSHGSFDSRVFFFQCYLFCKKKKKGGMKDDFFFGWR